MAYLLCGVTVALALWVLKKNLVIRVRHVNYISTKKKFAFQKTSSSTKDTIKFVLCFPILLVLFLGLAILIPLMKIVKCTVGVVLKVRYGDEFYGLLTGLDALISTAPWKDSFIKSLLILECDKSRMVKSPLEHTKEMLEKKWRMFKKVFTTIERSMGYTYFKFIKLEITDVIRKMPTTEKILDRNELTTLIASCSLEDLPAGGTALWDLHVGTQPLVKWKSNSDPNIEYYPILVRTHHALADGVILIKLLKILFDNEEEATEKEHDPFEQHSRKATWFDKVLMYLNALIVFPSAAFDNMVLKGHDSNELQSFTDAGKEVFEFDTDELGVYLEKAKKIKRTYSKTSFPEILVAAFSESVYVYFEKHCSTTPEHVGLIVPVVQDLSLLRGIVSDKAVVTENDIGNHFDYVSMNLPLDIRKHKAFDRNLPMISRLNVIRHIANNLKNSYDFQFSHMFNHHIVGSLPFYLANLVRKRMSFTTSVSILPGPKKLLFSEETLAVSDVVFWQPNLILLGISFSILTFDARLQIGVHCKCNVIEQFDARELLDGVHKYIDLIEKEIDLICT